MKHFYAFFLLLIIATMSTSLMAQAYSGGSGNSGDPYLIATKADLKYLSENSGEWSKHFKQTANITFTDADFQSGGDFYNDGKGFIPIGYDYDHSFTGSYDGDGYSIDNLYIDRSTTNYIGFFGYLKNADIDGVNLNDVEIYGSNQTGALAGTFYTGTIDDCFVSGSVHGADNSGGLAGNIVLRSVMHNCGADVAVIGTYNVGGFAGRLYHNDDIDDNKPLITNSYATGNAFAQDRNVGGFVGWNAGLISQCYATGSATCNDGNQGRAGGFAGAVAYFDGSTGKIDNCFSSGDVSRNGSNTNYTYGLGGFVGVFYDGGSITNCYSTGGVSPHLGYYGGFCGNMNSGTSTGNYYNKETSGCDDTNANANPITNREMQTQGSFAGWDFMGESTNGSDNIWGINPFDHDGLPFLSWQGFDQFAVTPTGSGTEASPYQISTLPHLYWLSQYSQEWDKYFEQSTDIDASSAASWYDNAGFFPIGNENTGFAGHYEGNNHTVSNLTIDRSDASYSSDENYVGLFGATDGATIENLSITNANISGNAYVGALAGKTASTVVQYCYSSGTLLDGSTIGGLIGWNASSSEVKHCYNEATIDAHTKAGGLIGTNEAVVEYCYNSANVVGSSEYIGGLIGLSNYYPGPKYCYNTGQVSGLQYVGGLIGYGSAENCYNIGQVSAEEDYVGGLLGSGYAAYCYNTGEVTCTGSCDYSGGLTGYSSSSTTACYYDKNASGQSDDGGNSHGLSTMEMQMEYQYRAEESYQSDWDFMTQSSSGIWGISPIVNDGYPFLSWQGDDLYGTEPEGSGTTEDPYVVDGLTDLYWISQKTDRWDDHYIQSCDIDASGTTFWCGGSGFLPFGAGDANDEFSGTYDGQEHDISSLWINREHEDEVGFIGKSNAIGNVVENLGLPDAFIKGYIYVGGFIGYSSDGDISQCYISGTLIGINDYVGGIVGYNHGSALTNCYSQNSVSGHDYVGGLVGDLSYKYIRKCYSKGGVSGNSYTGGLIGNGTNWVEDSFWDTQTSGQVSSAAGTGKTTTEMTTQSTYTDAGWDFTTPIWGIDESENDGYPYLSWQTNIDPPPAGVEPTGNPREVSTLDHLLWICENSSSWGDNFILISDIDASATSAWNSGAGFSPIGTSSSKFTGNFNGQKHTISGLTINRPNQEYIGFFGYVNNGTISNITLENVDISGDEHIGGLAAYLAGTTNISSCNVTGSVSGTYRVGGVIGYDYMSGIGIIEESSFNGTVAADGANSGVGGFIGEKSGNSIIQKCSAEGTLTAAGRGCGGFVGWIDEGEINQSYSTINVTSSTSSYGRIGGFAGALSFYSNRAGEINNCYASGSVSAPNSTNTSSYGIGGFVGAYYQDNDNKVYNSYATGLVNAPNASNYVGGFSGEDHGNESSCGSGNFWNEETTGQNWSGCEGLGETGKTTAQMKTLSTYTNAGWDFVGETAHGTDDYWDMDESKVVEDGYPFLGYQETPMDWTGAVSSDWNDPDNWSKSLGVPNEHKDITIEATKSHDPEIPNDGASINNLTVSSGASLTVGDGGSLITYGTITNEGTISIEKTIADDGHWHFVSAPTNNATAAIFNGMYLQEWDEAAKEWLDITDPEEDLSPVQGYSLWSPDGGKGSFTFTGTPNTGNQDISLDYHDNSAQNDGANLVGNPYPSYIDWDQVSGYGSKYTWNGADYDERTEAGTGNGSRYVAPMEGFFVVTNSNGTEFTLTNAMRTHNSAKKEASALTNGIVLSANSQNYSDALYIVFDQSANENFELPRDAWKFISGTAGICQIWSQCPDGNLAVDVRPETESIQLGFANSEAGTYSIAIKEIADISTAILEDTKLNIFHDLTQGAYTFDWSLNDDETRFKLHLNTTAVEEISASAVQVYVVGSNIIIQSEQQPQRITLTDITGRTLGVWGNVENIPAPSSTGVYLVTVETDHNRITKKIIVE